MRLSFAIATGLLLCATPAAAQIAVLGTSAGRACYEDTLRPPNTLRDHAALNDCDDAVNDYTGGVYARAASYVNRGDLKVRLGDYKGTLDDANTAIALMPDLAQGYLNRGAGLLGLERYDDALRELDKAVALGGDKLAFAYFDRGLAKEYLGDVKGAYLDYRQASQLDPDFQRAKDQMARFTVTRH